MKEVDLNKRLYKLLKQQLRIEIEKNPPMFPWETTSLEYPKKFTKEQHQTTPNNQSN